MKATELQMALIPCKLVLQGSFLFEKLLACSVATSLDSGASNLVGCPFFPWLASLAGAVELSNGVSVMPIPFQYKALAMQRLRQIAFQLTVGSLLL